jgi:hypothetical protein
MMFVNDKSSARMLHRALIVGIYCTGWFVQTSFTVAATPPGPSTRPTTKLSPAAEERLEIARRALDRARGESLHRVGWTTEFKELSQRAHAALIDGEQARRSGTVQQQIDAEETHLKLLMASSQLAFSADNVDWQVAQAKAEVEAAEADKPPPPPASSPTTRSAETEARLQSSLQALTIARDECLGRLRQTPEFAELSERLRLSQMNREQAQRTGTALKQNITEEAHRKLLTELRDLMVSAMNADAQVAAANAALKATEAAAMGR